VSTYDVLLFLHVLAAFILVAAVVLHAFAITAPTGDGRPAEVVRTLRLIRVGEVLAGVGAVGTLVFGIALVIQVDRYRLWDGWIIAAFVLWLASGGAGDRASRYYSGVRRRAESLAVEGRDGPNPELVGLLRAPRGLALQGLAALLLLLLLVDMIWKPGA
jgi:uncharacterized membrane protein